jgi:hypothetical protein
MVKLRSRDVPNHCSPYPEIHVPAQTAAIYRLSSGPPDVPSPELNPYRCVQRILLTCSGQSLM